MAKVTITWAWVATAVTYDVQYKKSVDSIWITAAGSPMVNPVSGPEVDIQIDGLDAETLYDFRVRSNCTGGYQSEWDVETKSTTVMMNVTVSVGEGPTTNESITNIKFSVDAIDSGYVLADPIITPDSITFPLQASQNYVVVITINEPGTSIMTGSVTVRVNGLLIECVNTSAASPTDYTLHFDSIPGDIVMIGWTVDPCEVP